MVPKRIMIGIDFFLNGWKEKKSERNIQDLLLAMFTRKLELLFPSVKIQKPKAYRNWGEKTQTQIVSDIRRSALNALKILFFKAQKNLFV